MVSLGFHVGRNAEKACANSGWANRGWARSLRFLKECLSRNRSVYKMSSKHLRNVISLLKWTAMLRRTSCFWKSLSENLTLWVALCWGVSFLLSPSLLLVWVSFCQSLWLCLHLLFSLSFCCLSKSFLSCSHFFRGKIDTFSPRSLQLTCLLKWRSCPSGLIWLLFTGSFWLRWWVYLSPPQRWLCECLRGSGWRLLIANCSQKASLNLKLVRTPLTGKMGVWEYWTTQGALFGSLVVFWQGQGKLEASQELADARRTSVSEIVRLWMRGSDSGQSVEAKEWI